MHYFQVMKPGMIRTYETLSGKNSFQCVSPLRFIPYHLWYYVLYHTRKYVRKLMQTK